MYAIVMNPDGTYYTSPIFAYYCKITATDDYEKYRQSIYNRFYVVLNPNGTSLVKQYVFNPAKEFLKPSIHIVDTRTDAWIKDEDGHGCVAWLADVDFDADVLEIEPHLLEKCYQIGKEEQYQEYVDIETEGDIQNYLHVSGYMHDARVESFKQEGDTLHVLFDGCWGLKIELWFSGDVSYSLGDRTDPLADPYWYGANVQKENGYYWLIDDDEAQISDITDEYCYFKAKHIRYRVIPK